MSGRGEPGRGLLWETTVNRGEPASPEAQENPYWQEDESPPPPPGAGCVQRGLCCRTSPGWFAPGEVERAADLLGMDPDELVRTCLVIDSVELGEAGLVEVFTPVKLDRFGSPALEPARRVDDWYRLLHGPCIFYDGRGCRIYDARPIECRAYLCSNPPEANLSHEQIARMWLGG